MSYSVEYLSMDFSTGRRYLTERSFSSKGEALSFAKSNPEIAWVRNDDTYCFEYKTFGGEIIELSSRD